MSRPDPIQYAERLYAAIRTANFSPIAFLAFGNAVKDGVDFRRMPRMAAEPFMGVVGEMLELEEEGGQRGDIVDAEVASVAPAQEQTEPAEPNSSGPAASAEFESAPLQKTAPPESAAPTSPSGRPRNRR